jgi:hypothetical protein
MEPPLSYFHTAEGWRIFPQLPKKLFSNGLFLFDIAGGMDSNVGIHRENSVRL